MTNHGTKRITKTRTVLAEDVLASQILPLRGSEKVRRQHRTETIRAGTVIRTLCGTGSRQEFHVGGREYVSHVEYGLPVVDECDWPYVPIDRR